MFRERFFVKYARPTTDFAQYCAWHARRLSTPTRVNVTQCHACHVKRDCAIPNMTPLAKLTIGTAMRSSRELLRTVANGCERKSNVQQTHPQPPDPQSETGTLATDSGKMNTRETNEPECKSYKGLKSGIT